MVISFPFTGSVTLLAFLAWIPLLLVEDEISTKKIRSSNVFIQAFIVFTIYNLGTTWWVSYASLQGALLAYVLNTLFMTILFYLFHISKKYLGKTLGYSSLLFYWVSFEFLHYHWELSWPWLHLGNYFSIHPSWVQWYSVTGLYGGTVWILLSNILWLNLIKKKFLSSEKIMFKEISVLAGFTFLPLAISYTMYFLYTEEKHPLDIVIIQPNIDPYNEKFTSSSEAQIKKMFDLADSYVDENTDLLIAPETAIPEAFYEEDAKSIGSVQYILERKNQWKLPELIIGASTAKYFEQKNSRASRAMEGGPGFVEYYNSSLFINESDQLKFIHKSLLVPGAEIIPFSNWLPFLEELAITNGGTSGSLGIEKEAQIFKGSKGQYAPIICYESIWGALFANQCKKGAELGVVITNDGWWQDTPGYKQHASFSRLRAIENRRYIARAANTGISSVINQRGDVIKATSWWKPAIIKTTVQKNNELTFYAKFGDYIAKIFVLFSFLSLTLVIIRKVRQII